VIWSDILLLTYKCFPSTLRTMLLELSPFLLVKLLISFSSPAELMLKTSTCVFDAASPKYAVVLSQLISTPAAAPWVLNGPSSVRSPVMGSILKESTCPNVGGNQIVPIGRDLHAGRRTGNGEHS
jgi:hypothetical protein